LKRYKNINPPKFKVYNFKILNIDNLIDELGDERLGWRCGKFIDTVYRISLLYKSNNQYNKVYISDKDVKGILGELSHLKIIEFLNDNNIIRCERSGNNRFNYNKKLWFFKLNDDFFISDKTLIDIELGVLNKWLGLKNKKVFKVFDDLTVKKDESGKVIDDYVRYELKCCKKTDVNINKLDSVIKRRVYNQLNSLQNECLWDWIGKKDILKNEKLLSDVKVWESNYINELRNRYQNLRSSLFNLKNDNYENLSFFRDNYGGRLYNLYSRVIREFREYLSIEGEESVELDIKGSHISCLYYLIVELNNKDCTNPFINDIKVQLIKLGNKNFGNDFLTKHKSLFEGDGIFWSNDNKDDYNDFYGFMKSCFNDEGERGEYKKFINYILNSDSLRSRKNFKYKGRNIDELEIEFFGIGGWELINDLKKIDLFKYISKDKGRIKPFYRKKNISLILHKIENGLMDRCRKVMLDKNIIYISMFDSFIVKKNESKKIMKLLNEELRNVSSVVKFRTDIESSKNFI